MRTCEFCQKKFIARDSRAIYCSSECQVNAKNARARAKKKGTPVEYKEPTKREKDLTVTGVERVVFSDFYDLYRGKPEAKMRKCLKCRKEFRSHDNSRVCAGCQRQISNSSVRAGEVYEA